MIGRAEIEALIPHAGRMCLLTQVVSWDQTSIQCAASSHRALDNPLRAEGRLGAACGVEYAAQAMAVHGGLTGAIGERPKAGYLASLRGLVLHVDRLDTIEGDLIVDATKLAGDGAQVSYGFKISAMDKILLEGRAAVLLDMGRR